MRVCSMCVSFVKSGGFQMTVCAGLDAPGAWMLQGLRCSRGCCLAGASSLARGCCDARQLVCIFLPLPPSPICCAGTPTAASAAWASPVPRATALVSIAWLAERLGGLGGLGTAMLGALLRWAYVNRGELRTWAEPGLGPAASAAACIISRHAMVHAVQPAGDGPNGPHWVMVGLVPLFDPPRHDTKETIERCHAVRAGLTAGHTAGRAERTAERALRSGRRPGAALRGR